MLPKHNISVVVKSRTRARSPKRVKQKHSRITAFFSDLFKPRKRKIRVTRPIQLEEHDVLKHLACTCSVVALHAHLAKLKGDLSAEAFLEFRCLFPIGDEESKNLRYLFKLAWEDDAPHAHHVHYILQHFPSNTQIHKRIIEGLARQMLAAHAPSKKEIDWLHHVAEDLGVTRISMRQILERAEKPLEASPYALFNLPKKATREQMKQAYKRMMLKCHPDKVNNAKLPETLAAAEKLSTAATVAYTKLKSERSLLRFRA